VPSALPVQWFARMQAISNDQLVTVGGGTGQAFTEYRRPLNSIHSRNEPAKVRVYKDGTCVVSTWKGKEFQFSQNNWW
jgi:hypothetical protein